MSIFIFTTALVGTTGRGQHMAICNVFSHLKEVMLHVRSRAAYQNSIPHKKKRVPVCNFDFLIEEVFWEYINE
jgi:hypothetical protein